MSVLLKISGEELFSSESVYSDAARQIAALVGRGVNVSVVIGGGNYWRGRDTAASYDRSKSDQIGMLATVMNAINFGDILRVYGGLQSVVMTPFSVGAFTELFNRDRALEYQRNGHIALFAGGTGHPYFSTDMIAAIRAKEMGCDRLLFAKPVDGFYTADPRKDENAVKIPQLTYDDVIVKKLRAVDLTAACFCLENGVETVLFKLSAPDGIVKAATGSDEDILKIGSIVKS